MNLLSIAELAWRQVFPNPGDESAITREEFIETAIGEYAYQMLLFYWKVIADEGYFIFPSNLLTEVSLPVVNNTIDLSGLKVFRGLPSDLWLQNVGGIGCECEYVKSSINMSQLLCDDDAAPDDTRTYIPIGKQLKFPQGTHTTPLTIIYANQGEGLDADTIEVDDAIGAIVRVRLIEIYAGKTGKEDTTNNSNSEQ